MLLGSFCVKAARKMLVKLTPGPECLEANAFERINLTTDLGLNLSKVSAKVHYEKYS
jgi:hypothetical protein